MPADSAAARSELPLRDMLRRVDLRVLAPALLLTATGFLALASTRPALLGQQAAGAAVGLCLALALTLVPFRVVQASAWPVWIASTLLLVVVLFFGHGAKGAHRWLKFGDVQFQPSEFAKVAHVLLLARWIRVDRKQKTLRGLLIPFALTAVPAGLVLVEPDLGSALLFVPGLFAMLWAAGSRSSHLAGVVVLAVLSVPFVYPQLNEYQKKRVRTFLPVVAEIEKRFAPEDAPAPAESKAARAQRIANETYHIVSSKAAVAGGGVFGAGWREGPMNLSDRVPEDWTDFIFVVHAEEWGLAGVAALLLAWGGLIAGFAVAAQESRDPATRLLCVGSLTMLGVQAVVNIAMTMDLAPVVGVPLPFLSYGRSAMLSAWLLTGLALHARAQEPHVFTTSDFDR